MPHRGTLRRSGGGGQGTARQASNGLGSPASVSRRAVCSRYYSLPPLGPWSSIAMLRPRAVKSAVATGTKRHCYAVPPSSLRSDPLDHRPTQHGAVDVCVLGSHQTVMAPVATPYIWPPAAGGIAQYSTPSWPKPRRAAFRAKRHLSSSSFTDAPTHWVVNRGRGYERLWRNW